VRNTAKIFPSRTASLRCRLSPHENIGVGLCSTELVPCRVVSGINLILATNLVDSWDTARTRPSEIFLRESLSSSRTQSTPTEIFLPANRLAASL
jgi:hypothetical protein